MKSNQVMNQDERETAKLGLRLKAINASRYSTRKQYEYEMRKSNISKYGHDIEAVQTGMSLGKLLSPIIVGGIIVLLFLGFGSAAILQIIGSMNIWLWIIAITIFIILWRKSR